MSEFDYGASTDRGHVVEIANRFGIRYPAAERIAVVNYDFDRWQLTAGDYSLERIQANRPEWFKHLSDPLRGPDGRHLRFVDLHYSAVFALFIDVMPALHQVSQVHRIVDPLLADLGGLHLNTAPVATHVREISLAWRATRPPFIDLHHAVRERGMPEFREYFRAADEWSSDAWEKELAFWAALVMRLSNALSGVAKPLGEALLSDPRGYEVFLALWPYIHLERESHTVLHCCQRLALLDGESSLDEWRSFMRSSVDVVGHIALLARSSSHAHWFDESGAFRL